MKKLRMIKRYTLYAILYTLIFLAGCASHQKSSATELVQPRTTDTLFAQKWVNVYGDDDKSVEHYNIALMLRIMNQQDARIKELEEEIARLDHNVIQISGKIDNIKGTWKNIRKDCGLNGDSCLLTSKCSKHAIEEAVAPSPLGKPDYPIFECAPPEKIR